MSGTQNPKNKMQDFSKIQTENQQDDSQKMQVESLYIISRIEDRWLKESMIGIGDMRGSTYQNQMQVNCNKQLLRPLPCGLGLKRKLINNQTIKS